MQDTFPEIAVVVVNYGTADLAITAVESVLERQHGGRSVEIHLVDNASPGDDAAVIQAVAAERGWGTRVTLHLENENHGFGRGNNLVLKALAARDTPPDKVFLLNPDAELENEALAILADFLDGHPRVGCAGARITKPGDRPVTAAFRFPSMASEFAQHVGFGPVSRLFDRWQVPLPPDLPTGQVDWVAGAAVMFRFRAVVEAGFFDPDYFLYYEEVDLMWQLHQRGWECWYVADAHVTHAEGAATQVRSGESIRRRRPAYWYDSRRIYSLKTQGRALGVANAAVVALAAGCNHVVSFLRRRESGLPLDFLSDHWRLVFLPLLTGREAPR